MFNKKRTINQIPKTLKDTLLFRNIFIKNGHNERASNFISKVHILIKNSHRKKRLITKPKKKKNFKIIKITRRGKKYKILKKINSKRPGEIIRPIPYLLLKKAIYKLKPGFILRRLNRAGKNYQIPVPISNHRASYLAIKWFRDATLQDTKTSLTISQLIFNELRELLRNKGKAIKNLRSYISTAIDQRPFTKFLRKTGDTRPRRKKKKKGKSKEYLKNPAEFDKLSFIQQAQKNTERIYNRRLRQKIKWKNKKQKKRVINTRRLLNLRKERIKGRKIQKARRKLFKLFHLQKKRRKEEKKMLKQKKPFSLSKQKSKLKLEKKIKRLSTLINYTPKTLKKPKSKKGIRNQSLIFFKTPQKFKSLQKKKKIEYKKSSYQSNVKKFNRYPKN